MLGIILTGHGSFATGFYQAVVQIIGEQAQFTAVDFPDGMSSDELELQLKCALKNCDNGDGVIFLTDILGGSPFKIASTLSYGSEKIEVITGTNMPLLLEMLLQRDGLGSENFRNAAINCAKLGITSLWHEHQKRSPTFANDMECCDGI